MDRREQVVCRLAREFQYADWRATAYPESDDWPERAECARMALREAVLMAEANGARCE